MKNDPRIEVASFSGTNADAQPEALINRLYPEAGQNGRAQQGAPYGPQSVEIEDFIKHESSIFGLTRSDLGAIAGDAISKGDTRKENLARFLNKNFSDVVSLSDDQPKNRITTDDLKLYHSAVKQRELSNSPSDFNLGDFAALHYNHHLRTPLVQELPIGMAGAFGSMKGINALAKTSTIAEMSTAFGKRYPVAAPLLTLGAYFTGGFTGGIASVETANALKRGFMSPSVRTHFYDEAAPALWRLTQG